MNLVPILITLVVATSTTLLSTEFMESAEPTPSPAIYPTPQPTITQVPTPTTYHLPPATIVIPAPTRIPVPRYSPQEVYDMYNRFGVQYGANPDVLRHIAQCESGFDSSATNYIYAGLYQFDSRTWGSYRNKMGKNSHPDLRFNPEAAIETAAYVLSLGKGHIWPNCMPK